MTFFYIAMAALIVGTFIPSALFLLLYGVTGEKGALQRARALWNFTRVLSLVGVNLLIWGHVAVGLWDIGFH